MTANAYDFRSKKTALGRTVTQAQQYSWNALDGQIDKIVPYI